MKDTGNKCIEETVKELGRNCEDNRMAFMEEAGGE